MMVSLWWMLPVGIVGFMSGFGLAAAFAAAGRGERQAERHADQRRTGIKAVR